MTEASPAIATKPIDACLKSLKNLVRVKGLEPPLPYGKQILSLPRLPFRHTRTRAECACSAPSRQGPGHGRKQARSVDLTAGSADRAGKDASEEVP
jgi:hypothetical protein